MDIDYKSAISFEPLKKVIEESGYKIKFIASKLGIEPTSLSGICNSRIFPTTDVIARIAFILKVPVSRIVSFDIKPSPKQEEWFKDRTPPSLPPEAEGKLSYAPLWILVQMYLDYYNTLKGEDKKADDLFDMIEPYRRRNGLVNIDQARYARLAVEARFGEGYKSKRERTYKAKGLTVETRSKLKNDVTLNIRSVYDICNFFGCSIDWVVSYK